MSDENLILNGSNATLNVTNLAAAPSGTSSLTALPLGTSDDTATGEIVLKIIIVS